MATMHVKNKYALTFSKMIRETENEKGVCDNITVSPNEAWGILNEMVNCMADWQMIPIDPLQNRIGPFDIKEAEKIILEWLKGDYSVRYCGLPVLVVREKPNVPTPKGSIPPKDMPTEPVMPSNTESGEYSTAPSPTEQAYEGMSDRKSFFHYLTRWLK